MKVTITEQNIDQFKSGTFPEIEEIKWELNYLDGEVLGNFPNLKELNCSNNQLTTLRGLENLSQLQKLNCSFNKLVTLQELENLKQLQILHCFYNNLTDLRGLENLTQLREFLCSDNQLTNLQGLENLTQLQDLDFSCNQLTTLQGLENLTQLLIFYCFDNQLTTLQGLENLTQLQTLFCFRNQLTDLLPIVYLTNLTQLSYHNNPLNPPTIQEERFLQRLLQRLQTRTNQTIYTDAQNVHNTTIQKSVLQSTTNLLKDPKPPKPDITQLSNQSQTLLQTYFQDTTPHSVLLITYEELFSYVWARIQQSPHKDTLIQILEQELKDSTDLCYTGRFNRTINTLNGFYDDIEVQISDPDRINAIIHQHQTKEDIIQALQEAGYDEQTIANWTTDL